MKTMIGIMLFACIANASRLTVYLNPVEAVEAGACWSVDGKSWHGSGESIEMTGDGSVILFNEIDGWYSLDEFQCNSGNNTTVVVYYEKKLPESSVICIEMHLKCANIVRRSMRIVTQYGASAGYNSSEDLLSVKYRDDIGDCWFVETDTDGVEQRLKWDCRPLQPTMVWTLVVSNPESVPLNLNCTLLFANSDYAAFLESVATGESWNLLETDGITIAAGTRQTFRLTVTINGLQERELSLRRGWNALSVDCSLREESQKRLLAMLPMGISGSSFVRLNRIEPGVAFWVFSREAETIPLLGYETETRNATIRHGWNFTAVFEATTPPDDALGLWQWNGFTYAPAETMLPGNAYWLFMP